MFDSRSMDQIDQRRKRWISTRKRREDRTGRSQLAGCGACDATTTPLTYTATPHPVASLVPHTSSLYFPSFLFTVSFAFRSQIFLSLPGIAALAFAFFHLMEAVHPRCLSIPFPFLSPFFLSIPDQPGEVLHLTPSPLICAAIHMALSAKTKTTRSSRQSNK
ncbi:hypothetical protein BGW80DRAFT_837309 [Lactifluus volemus]|nr:hypothetical protein BGW80DRAFT_837309 [Lactifluus volemus]